MFKEILKIIPRLDNTDLNKMEKSLSSRFGRIAKKFGKGMVGALTGGGIAGLALGLIDKLLNPLKETQEAIDRVLKQGDDIVTNAKQFGTTAGKLFKLQQLAKNQGLDEEALNVLLGKFQTAVAEAAADPNKKTSVRAFVGEKDTAEAFFSFIQGLQKLDKNSQVLVQQEVFGEKQILKMAEFLQADFGSIIKNTRLKGAESYTPGLENLADLEQLQRNFQTQREAGDIMQKSRLINAGMIESQNRAEKLNLEKENARIQSYQSLATISEASGKILGVIEKGFLMLSDLVTKVTGLSETVRKFSGSSIFRGLFGGDK